MKNRFFGGFWAGLASAFILFTLVGVIYFTATESEQAKAGTLTEQSTQQQMMEEANFQNKLSALRTIIDLYFWKDVDNETLYEGIYRGLLNSLDDPYSRYYTAEEYQEEMESMEGSYCGIGALVNQNMSTRIMTIVRPFVDGPAYKAGILPGDIIYMVDDVDVTGEELSKVVKMMKGEQGTKVKLTVVREGVNEPIEVEITRDVIEVETVTYEMLDNNIGYIYIMEFDEITLRQFEQAIDELEKAGMKGLIVDIRDNGGGLLDTVCKMLDRIIPNGNIVYTLDKYGNREEINATSEASLDIPIAVLVNGNSASASEIFAGALQDYKLATIVGTQTFGKGIVQSIVPLRDGSAVKVTVSTYYTPNGRSIHGEGVTPDVVVELNDELKQQVIIEKENDNQLNAAIEVIQKQIQKQIIQKQINKNKK